MLDLAFKQSEAFTYLAFEGAVGKHFTDLECGSRMRLWVKPGFRGFPP